MSSFGPAISCIRQADPQPHHVSPQCNLLSGPSSPGKTKSSEKAINSAANSLRSSSNDSIYPRLVFLVQRTSMPLPSFYCPQIYKHHNATHQRSTLKNSRRLESGIEETMVLSCALKVTNTPTDQIPTSVAKTPMKTTEPTLDLSELHMMLHISNGIHRWY